MAEKNKNAPKKTIDDIEKQVPPKIAKIEEPITTVTQELFNTQDCSKNLPSSSINFQKIASISQFSTNIKIQEVDVQRGKMNVFSKQDKAGKIFSFIMQDESAEIKVNAWNEDADKYSNYIQIGSVYEVRNLKVVVANRNFNYTDMPVELTITQTSEIKKSQETHVTTPAIEYTHIKDIKNINDGTQINVIGICEKIGEIEDVNSSLKKLEIELKDLSDMSICITLWNHNADNFSKLQKNTNTISSES